MKYKLPVLSLGFLMVVILSGCGKVVPPGTTVIILTPSGESKIIRQGLYLGWGRDKIYFVDTKLKSYAKNLKILCADDINMDVSVKWVGSFAVTENTINIIKAKVPASPSKRGDMSGYELSLDKFYQIAMDDIISSITRTTISKYKTDNIREKREEIRNTIKKKVIERLVELKYPVETADVLITNLDYPPEITAMRKKIKNAELKDLENAAIAKAEVAKARRDAEIAVEKGKAKLVEAEADAAANRVRAASLTPEIIMIKQIEMYEKLASGPNNTAILIPFNALGSDVTNTMILKNAIDQQKNTLPQPKKKK
jgi:regulator of protease activity HflC (stomatin/prohibitin superfamily)